VIFDFISSNEYYLHLEDALLHTKTLLHDDLFILPGGLDTIIGDTV
jgi:hypothetical protein